MEIGVARRDPPDALAQPFPNLLEEQLRLLLQQILAGDLRALSLERIKASSTPATVFRARLVGGGPGLYPASLLIKLIEPDWPEDPAGPDREVNFYTRLHPLLGLSGPRLVFSGCLPDSRQRLLIIEDLHAHRALAPGERWSMEQARCFIRAYARLHSCPLPNSPDLQDWLYPIRLSTLDPAQLLEQAAALSGSGHWGPLPHLESLLRWALEAAGELAGLPQSLIHNDVYPPNILLPADLSEEAVLVDWEMAGCGLPEMDLAFMFLQPYGSAEALDRAQVLAAYWDERCRLGDAVPTAGQRRIRQRFADALWGLSLVRVAHRSIARPFPAGSPPERYWESMRPILYSWLQRLSDSLAR